MLHNYLILLVYLKSTVFQHNKLFVLIFLYLFEIESKKKITVVNKHMHNKTVVFKYILTLGLCIKKFTRHNTEHILDIFPTY